MNAPWFDPNLAWLPGTALGVVGGVFGGIVGILMPLSRERRRLIGMRCIKLFYILLLISSAVLLGASLIALISGQPYGIWYGLGLAGFIGSAVFGAQYPLIFHLPKRIQAEWDSGSR